MAMSSILLMRKGLSVNGFRSLWSCRALLTDQAENVNAQQSSQERGKDSDEEYEKNIKSKILAASLKYVHNLGWSQQAISAGAESIGYPGVIHGLFPNRGADLVQYFYLTCNKELNKILKERSLANEENPDKMKKTLEYQVRDAVETRLRMVIPYKKTWPQALALMTLPPNVPMSLANLLTLVDDICYYAGDRSVDINWYTRRVVLAGIYKTTELYMLQDNSEDHNRTWNFLERRIKDATQIHAILMTTSDMPTPDQALNRASEAASAAFVTVSALNLQNSFIAIELYIFTSVFVRHAIYLELIEIGIRKIVNHRLFNKERDHEVFFRVHLLQMKDTVLRVYLPGNI